MSYSDVLGFWRKKEGYVTIPQSDMEMDMPEGESASYGEESFREVDMEAKQSSNMRKWAVIGSILLLAALGLMAVARNTQSEDILGHSPRYALCHTHCDNPCSVYFVRTFSLLLLSSILISYF